MRFEPQEPRANPRRIRNIPSPVEVQRNLEAEIESALMSAEPTDRVTADSESLDSLAPDVASESHSVSTSNDPKTRHSGVVDIEPTIGVFAKRIEALEKSNTRLRAFCILAIIVPILVAAPLIVESRQTASSEAPSDVLRSREFQLLDDSERVRAKLCMNEGGPAVLLFDGNGKNRAYFGVFDNTGPFLDLLTESETTAAGLSVIEGVFDTSTAMGRMFLTMAAGFAELERNLIRERTSTALAHKKSKGEYVGDVPFGFDLAADGKTLTANTTEQEAIRLMRVLRTRGLSYRAIASKLETTGVRPKKGNRWIHTTIRSILTRAA